MDLPRFRGLVRTNEEAESAQARPRESVRGCEHVHTQATLRRMFDLATVVGDSIAGLGVAVAALSGALGAIFGYRAVMAGREAVAEGRRAVAEARAARQEERLYQELARLERVIALVKRMWAIINRASVWRATPEAGELAWQEMDGLLYELRAGLAVLDPGELPRCRNLVDGKDGRAALYASEAILDAESDVTAATKRCRDALRALGRAVE